MKIENTNGIGGKWIKIIIDIEDKTYRCDIAPNGLKQFSLLGAKKITRLSSNGATALMINKHIEKVVAI